MAVTRLELPLELHRLGLGTLQRCPPDDDKAEPRRRPSLLLRVTGIVSRVPVTHQLIAAGITGLAIRVVVLAATAAFRKTTIVEARIPFVAAADTVAVRIAARPA